jgi:hypothetical protein
MRIGHVPGWARLLDEEDGPDGQLQDRRRERPMKGTTGHKCPQSGIWQCDRPHHEQIALSVNETFPPCSGGSGAAVWTLVRSTR